MSDSNPMMVDLDSIDLDSFLETELDGELSTERLRLADGDYPALVSEISKPKKVTSSRGDQLAVSVKFDIQCEEFKSTNKISGQVFRTKDYWLELNEHGGLDRSPGKNVDLGKLREACGKNGAGQSIMACSQSLVTVRIKNNVGKDGVIRDQINGVSAHQ